MSQAHELPGVSSRPPQPVAFTCHDGTSDPSAGDIGIAGPGRTEAAISAAEANVHGVGHDLLPTRPELIDLDGSWTNEPVPDLRHRFTTPGVNTEADLYAPPA